MRRVGHGLLWVAVSVAEVDMPCVFRDAWVEILPKVVDRGTRYLRSA